MKTKVKLTIRAEVVDWDNGGISRGKQSQLWTAHYTLLKISRVPYMSDYVEPE